MRVVTDQMPTPGLEVLSGIDVESCPDGPLSPSWLARRGSVDLYLAYGPVGAARFAERVHQLCPQRALLLEEPTAALSVHCVTGRSHSSTVETESYGSLLIRRVTVTRWVPSSDVVPPSLPPRTHGPAASPTILPWPIGPVEGRGMPVKIEDPALLRMVLDGLEGRGGLYVQPGFPFCLPRKPKRFLDQDGLLCAPVHPETTWTWLSVPDLAGILGYAAVDAVWTWDALRALFPLSFLSTLLAWARLDAHVPG